MNRDPRTLGFPRVGHRAQTRVVASPTERTRAQLDALSTTGLDTPTFVAATLEVLHRAVPFAAACFATTDPATRLVTSALKSGTMTTVTPEQDELWAFHEYVVEDVYDYRDLLDRPGGVTTTHRETAGDPLRCSRYENFLHPLWGVTDELRTAVTADGSMWAFLALFRDTGDRAATFNAAEMEFVSTVSTPLARGVRAGLVTSLAGAAPVEEAGPGVIVVDDRGDVLSANPAAARRVAELGGPELGRGALPMPVQSVVKAARRFAQGRQDWAPRVRMRTTDGRWVVVSASPMTSFGPSAVPTFAVTIEDAGRSDVLPLLVEAFGLTAREQDVVRLVLRGVSTAEIATTLHLSAYTVQDHLKVVFDKVGVRSRRELTARVFVEEYAPKLGRAVGPSGSFA
ncbi:regulatory LuxR family protein [Kineococcus rhizosphaerae]|uniref:Regulatory LuxR family protein n=1 Tax=Kineococcus rhizosphaerae TaxID=559628 RepID=A0A2T0QXY8_9ACTN|nr:regulatory LuxR family protein [Kineococcus rhizosphaerae]